MGYGNQDITYRSSDPSVATVDANGNIIGRKEGTAVITGNRKDGTTYKTTVSIKAFNPLNVFKEKVTISFRGNGATSGSMSSQKMVKGEYNNIKANKFKRKGYNFKGWSDSKYGRVKWKNKARVKPYKNKTIYAIWDHKSYKVKFRARGGKGKMSAQYFKHGIKTRIKGNRFSKFGYYFVGWTNVKGSSKAKWKNKQAVRWTKGGTLYAVWKRDTKHYCTAKFSSNGGKGKMKSMIVRKHKAFKMPKNKFKRKGYKFTGWATSSTAKQAVYKKSGKLSKNGTFYAIWSKKAKIKYDPNGGSGKAYTQTFWTNKYFNLNSNKFKRDGYKFVGWKSEKASTVVWGNRARVSFPAGGTLYAVWQKKSEADIMLDTAKATPSDTKYVIVTKYNSHITKVYDKTQNYKVVKSMGSCGSQEYQAWGPHKLKKKYTEQTSYGRKDGSKLDKKDRPVYYEDYVYRYDSSNRAIHTLLYEISYDKDGKKTYTNNLYNNDNTQRNSDPMGADFSNGCTRVTRDNAKWIWNNCGIGTGYHIME